MRIIALSSVCILIGALFLAAAPTPDEKENGRNGVKFTYAAQVTCGFDPPSGILRIMPGQYATAVHVHNPTAESVTFRKRLALTFPDSDFGSAQKPGLVSGWIEDTLEPGQALEVDCGEVPGEFFPGIGFPPYVQGILAIHSPATLDVIAVYTTASVDAQGALSVRSLDVEQVKERRVNGPQH